jgi:hypothetical protein
VLNTSFLHVAVVTSCVVIGGSVETENEVVIAGVEVVLCTFVEVAAADVVNACPEAVPCDGVKVEDCCTTDVTSCVVVTGTVVVVCADELLVASVVDNSVVVDAVGVDDGKAIMQ